MSVRKDYFDMVQTMVKRRKATDLRYLDLERVEIESNIGWLVNPALPKTGGFNAMLKQAIGVVGSKIGKGEKPYLDMKQQEKLGRKLTKELTLSRGGRDLSLKKTLGEFDGLSNTTKYVGLGLVGLLAAGAIWYFVCNKPKPPVAAKKKRKKRSRKRRK
jgi:hypothetical protein